MTQLAEVWDSLTDIVKRLKALEEAAIDGAKLQRSVAELAAWRAMLEGDASRALSKYRALVAPVDTALSDTMRDAGLD